MLASLLALVLMTTSWTPEPYSRLPQPATYKQGWFVTELQNIQRAFQTAGVFYPALEGETGVVNKWYPYGDVRRYGAVGDGVADDIVAFSRASDSADAAGFSTITVPDGTYLLGPSAGAVPGTDGEYSVQLGDGVTLAMAPGALLVRNHAGSGSLNSTIRNKDMAAGNSRVSVVGGRITTLNVLNTGKHVTFWFCTKPSLRGTQFEGVSADWNTNFRDCDTVRIAGVVMDSGTALFTDGLHIQGCQDVRISDCDITCGDDALAIVEESTFADRDCTDVKVANCTFRSRLANAVKIRVAANVSPTRAIRGVQLVNCDLYTGGGSGNPGLYIEDLTNTGLVSDITLASIRFDASDNNADIKIDGAANVTWRDMTIDAPESPVRVDNASKILFDNLTISGIRGASEPAVYVGATGAVDGFTMNKGSITGATAQGVVIAAGAAVTNALIDGVTIEDCDSDGLTFGANTGTNCRATNVTAANNGAFGINVNAAATRVSLTDNKCPGNTSGGIFGGTNTYRRGNRFTDDPLTGTFTLANGTVTVSTTEIRTGDRVQLTRSANAGTTVGILVLGAIVNATSFVVNATDLAGVLSADDDGSGSYEILH